jgi:hypothetical protein
MPCTTTRVFLLTSTAMSPRFSLGSNLVAVGHAADG